MVADTFLRNPGNPPVYPLRYEKKKKKVGAYKTGVEREKCLKWEEPKRRPVLLGAVLESAPPPASSLRAGQDLVLQPGRWGPAAS